MPRTMTPALVDELAERFKALGESARLQLLLALRGGERSVSDLVESTGLGQANVSKHLQQLHQCGFLIRLNTILHRGNPGNAVNGAAVKNRPTEFFRN